MVWSSFAWSYALPLNAGFGMNPLRESQSVWCCCLRVVRTLSPLQIVLAGVYVLSTRKMGGMRAQLLQDADDEILEATSSREHTGTPTRAEKPPASSSPLHESGWGGLSEVRSSPGGRRGGWAEGLSLAASRRRVRRRASAMAALPPSALPKALGAVGSRLWEAQESLGIVFPGKIPAQDGAAVMRRDGAATLSIGGQEGVDSGPGTPWALSGAASWHDVTTPRAADLRPGAGRHPTATTLARAGAAAAGAAATGAAAAAAALPPHLRAAGAPGARGLHSRRGTEGPLLPRGALRVDWFVAAAGAWAEDLAEADAEVIVWRRRRGGGGAGGAGAPVVAASVPNSGLPSTPAVAGGAGAVRARFAYRHGVLGRATSDPSGAAANDGKATPCPSRAATEPHAAETASPGNGAHPVLPHAASLEQCASRQLPEPDTERSAARV